ncbi:MAG: hypothetical protein A3K65_09360 [Euryarchaeota archaeon RBG_16_68_12]|nr:MAG: hypothetical protein A3K65_09360 [Euryarchaeota archaeon RBG_16_68_12]
MSEFEDVLAALNRSRVRYLLIGGLASVLHGVPRTTVDIDLVLDPKKENVRRAVRALKRIGLVADTEAVDDILAQGGVTASNRVFVDLLTDIPSATFPGLWRRRKAFRYGRVRASAISRADQIRVLRRTGRKKDIEDADYLDSLR